MATDVGFVLHTPPAVAFVKVAGVLTQTESLPAIGYKVGYESTFTVSALVVAELQTPLVTTAR